MGAIDTTVRPIAFAIAPTTIEPPRVAHGGSGMHHSSQAVATSSQSTLAPEPLGQTSSERSLIFALSAPAFLLLVAVVCFLRKFCKRSVRTHAPVEKVEEVIDPESNT